MKKLNKYSADQSSITHLPLLIQLQDPKCTFDSKATALLTALIAEMFWVQDRFSTVWGLLSP